MLEGLNSLPGSTSQTKSRLSSAVIDRLFDRMALIFGARLADQWRGLALEDIKEVWAEALADLTMDDLKTGVDGLRHLKFPPTIGEFRALCRPPVDYEGLFKRAAQQYARRVYGGGDDWPSPAVFWAAARIGRDMIERTWEDLKGRWKTELDRALAEERAGALPEIPPAREALPAPGHTYTPDRVAEIRKRINELTSRRPEPSKRVGAEAQWPAAFGTGQKAQRAGSGIR